VGDDGTPFICSALLVSSEVIDMVVWERSAFTQRFLPTRTSSAYFVR
jgi:hypothetical protein